jgi:hypothetical protein
MSAPPRNERARRRVPAGSGRAFRLRGRKYHTARVAANNSSGSRYFPLGPWRMPHRYSTGEAFSPVLEYPIAAGLWRNWPLRHGRPER